VQATAEIVMAVLGFICFWMRLEHRLTKLETQIFDVKENCKLCSDRAEPRRSR
jgi:hypothetical protein